jgi:endonuclease/exonuclease/phosphatase (EEP) superfamily protein YafD
MLLKMTRVHFKVLLFVITLISFAPKGVEASRFVIPDDNNVLKVINKDTKSMDFVIPRDDIKVLVWNMYKAGKDSWAQDYKKLSRGVDILLLQEILTVPKMMQTISKDQRTYFLATSFMDKKRNLARTGTATASTFEPVRVGWQRSKYREPIIRTPKMVTIAEYDLEGTDDNLLTLNIHAINFVSTRKLKHMIEAGLIEARKHRGPVIFGGDFNTWSKKKLKMMYDLMAFYGFKDVKFPRLAQGDDGRMKTFGNILDHVFVRGLKVKKSKVYASIEGSDHKAMEVHLSY